MEILNKKPGFHHQRNAPNINYQYNEQKQHFIQSNGPINNVINTRYPPNKQMIKIGNNCFSNLNYQIPTQNNQINKKKYQKQ